VYNIVHFSNDVSCVGVVCHYVLNNFKKNVIIVMISGVSIDTARKRMDSDFSRLGTTPDMRDSLVFPFQSMLKC